MHPSLDKFKTPPEALSEVTMVTCISANFGTVTYYLPLDDFQDNIKSIIIPCWINGIIVHINPL